MRKRQPKPQLAQAQRGSWQGWGAFVAIGLFCLMAAGCGASDSSSTPSGLPTRQSTSLVLPTPISTVASSPTSSRSGTVPSTIVAPAAPVAARVNGVAISLDDFNQQAAAAEAYLRSQNTDLNSAEGRDRLKQLRQQVLDGLIEQVLIEQSASEMGITLSDAQLDANLQKTIDESGGQTQFERWLAQNKLTRNDFRRSLKSNLLGAQLREKVIAAVPTRGEQVHVRHILLDDQQKAEQLLARLKAGADFATLAQQNSLDLSTRDNGGDLGWLPHGLTTPEFEKAAFALSKGQLSGVVPSSFGFHLIQVLERDPNRALSSDMQVAVREAAFTQWLEALKAKAKIERFVE